MKTSEGALWAASQCHVLKSLGIDVHVVLPSPLGQTMAEWKISGAKIHIADISLPEPYYMIPINSFRQYQ